MIAVFTLVIVVTVSLLVVRIGGVALSLTGLSEDTARFQALSAFTGAGFTTSEAEHVVNHPVRRRIIMILLRLGSAGVVSALASLFLSFSGVKSGAEGIERGVWLAGLLLALFFIARSQWVDRHLTRVIRKVLQRYSKQLEIRDYADLLHLTEGYGIAEFEVDDDDWIADRSLAECDLTKEGFNVLGIRREGGSYVGSPRGKTEVHGGDVLLIYGKRDKIDELESRLKGVEGDRRHEEAKEEHEKEMAEQEREEAQEEERRQEKQQTRK